MSIPHGPPVPSMVPSTVCNHFLMVSAADLQLLQSLQQLGGEKRAARGGREGDAEVRYSRRVPWFSATSDDRSHSAGTKCSHQQSSSRKSHGDITLVNKYSKDLRSGVKMRRNPKERSDSYSSQGVCKLTDANAFCVLQSGIEKMHRV